MPRIRNDEEIKKATIRSIIDGRGSFYGYKRPELAKRAGMNYSTFSRRMNEPLTFTLEEIGSLNRVLHFEETDKVKLVKAIL